MNQDLESLLNRTKEVISEVRSFSLECLGLPIKKGFNDFKEDGQNYFWVYVSEKRSLNSVVNKELQNRPCFFDDREKAEDFSRQYQSKGYDTYVYEGSAHSGEPQITLSFINSSIYRKASVLIHESVHNFLEDCSRDKDFSKIPYDLNEALATYIGERGALNFCKIHYPSQVIIGLKNITFFEEFSKRINVYHSLLQVNYANGLGEEKIILDSFKKELKSMGIPCKREDDFNNAYLAMFINYTRLYPIISNYFSDGRRTIKGLFGCSRKKKITKFERLLKLREEFTLVL
ncbi:MAG: aminopeptidase [Nanoarchaeota archaeon]|nr:aminopeptidase [Nanoarchaeota archaeon]MBU1976353.1 aminopeptidase [Nanoarchaeota archaeon]